MFNGYSMEYACRYLAALLIGLLKGRGKEEVLSSHYSPVADYWERARLVPEIDEIALGSFKRNEPPEIQGTGFVVLLQNGQL